MSNYANAPACKMLATHCLFCNRPLVDAISVESGVGPICRSKYGISSVHPEHQKKVNQLIHNAAIYAKEGNTKELEKISNEILKLGYYQVASKIAERFVSVRIIEDGNNLKVFAPYHEGRPNWWQATGARWIKNSRKDKYWFIQNGNNARSKRQLFNFLRRYFSGMKAYGSKGYFEIS